MIGVPEYAHGGDIYGAAEILKRPPNALLDFSASVNPLGPSKKVKAELRRHLKDLGAYPDPAFHRLRNRLSKRYDLPPEALMVGNGSNELLHLLVAVLSPRRILVTAPSFSEYERAGRHCGADVVKLRLEADADFRIEPETFATALDGVDMAFLCNPNNPTGSLLEADAVAAVVDGAEQTGCLLVVDEAFIDFCGDGTSVVGLAAQRERLVVLRSLTAYHALAGLRIGFAAMSPALAGRIGRRRDPWSVNTLAQRAAVVALADRVYRRETGAWLKAEKPWLEQSLRRLGFRVLPAAANYLLVRHERAAALRQALFHRGLILRGGSTFDELDEHWLRIAVRSHRDNTRLIKALGHLLQPENRKETP